MTIQHLVDSSFEKVMTAYDPLCNAVMDLHNNVQSVDPQVAHSADFLGQICKDIAASIDEAKGDRSKMPNLSESLNRLTMKFHPGFADLTQRLDVYSRGAKVSPQTNAKRCAVAEAFLNFQTALYQMNEWYSTDVECSPSPEPYPVPDEIKIQANLLCRVFGEVYDRIKVCRKELNGLHTYDQLDDGFKDTAVTFIQNLIGAVGQLTQDCDSAIKILETRCVTPKDVIKIIGKYETRLKDMMIFYKGITDLINLETSSRQLPPEFLQCLTPYLVKPFEVHNNLQILIVKHLDIIGKGKIGACLRQLIELCEQLENSNEDFVKDLREIDGNDAPDFVTEFLSGLDGLKGKLAGACQGIRQAAADPQISENPERALAGLQQFLIVLKDAQEGSFFKLSNDLSEAIRLQQILPSWRERANWVARAKVGLKEFWERISDLITRSRTCLDEVEVLIQKPKRRRVRVNPAEIADEVLKGFNGIVVNLDTLGSAAPLDAAGGGGGYPTGAYSNIDSRISSGITSYFGTDLKPPHTTDAEVLAFAQKLKNTLQKSVVKTSRYGSSVYELQRGGAVPTGSVSSSQIRGTQATFYKQAVQLKELVSGLLDKLTCQLLVCDEETIDFFKEDIRTNVNEIVAEVGREGGALPQRVNALLLTLADDLPALRLALGIQAPPAQQKDMDIADREENERNFRLLEDSLTNPGSTLTNLLVQYNAEIVNATGTVLSNLLRTIEAIPPSIQEVYRLMDSVRLGEVDRRVTLVAGNTTVEQLLSWIEISASTDWPSRLGIGGTREVEVRAVERTANQQILLLNQLIANLPNLIQTGVNRVGGALRELLRELQDVSLFASRI